MVMYKYNIQYETTTSSKKRTIIIDVPTELPKNIYELTRDSQVRLLDWYISRLLFVLLVA